MGTDQPSPKRRWRPRFSLLTLVLGVLFVGSCGGLWWRWEPWVCERHLNELTSDRLQMAISLDRRHLLVWTQQYDNPIVSSRGQSELIAWDLVSGQPIVRLKETRVISHAAFSVDNRRILTATYGRNFTDTIHVWDTSTGQLLSTLDLQDRRIHEFTMTSDGSSVIAEGLDLTIWDGRTWATRLEHRLGQWKWDLRLPNITEQQQQSQLSDELVRQTERSQALSLKDLSAKGSAPIFCRISPDGERLFTMIQVGDGFKAQLWDTSSLKKIADLELPWAERTRRIPPVKPIVRSGPYVSFSSDGRFVLCWYDDELRAWDSRSGLRIVSFRTGLAGLGGSSVHIDQFAEIARDRSLLLLEGLVFDFQGNWISSCPYSGRCYSTEISPDGKRILFATSAGVLISDSHSGAHLTTFARSQDFIGLSALFDAEGRVVLLLNDGVQIYSRRRPEYWWGIAWLPEFWVALLSGGALVVIAVRRLRARKAVKQEAA